MELAKEVIGDFAVLSRALSIKIEGLIISLVRPGERNILDFVMGFETPVWILILLSILSIPFAIALIQKSFSGFFTNLWNYSYLILSEAIPRRAITVSTPKQLFLTLLLLSGTVLLAAYSGVLIGFFIRSTPDDLIDSWDDLYQRNELKIVTHEYSFIHNFVQKHSNDNPMAQNFLSRMEVLPYDYSFIDTAVNMLFSEKYVASGLNMDMHLLAACKLNTTKNFKHD
jgi:hypothetical protein